MATDPVCVSIKTDLYDKIYKLGQKYSGIVAQLGAYTLKIKNRLIGRRGKSSQNATEWSLRQQQKFAAYRAQYFTELLALLLLLQAIDCDAPDWSTRVTNFLAKLTDIELNVLAPMQAILSEMISGAWSNDIYFF